MASTEKQVQFKVECLRRIPDPVTPDARVRYFAVVNVENLPVDLPMDTNPRDQKTTTKVAKDIKSGLLGETSGQLFHLLNRGLLISADRIDFNNKTRILTVYLPDGEKHGLVDGGHTYRIIQDNIAELSTQQFVNLEIMTGIEEDFTEIAGARNTSVQVDLKSLEELKKNLDTIKQVVSGQPFADRIAYRQFEEKEIDVLEVISLLTIFNIDLYPDSAAHPIRSYSSKQKNLEQYLENGNWKTYAKLKPIAGDVFRLHDHVLGTFWDYYNEAVGGGRLGGRKEITKKDHPHYPLRFSPVDVNGDVPKIRYGIPAGFVYPILGAMRFLVEKSGDGSVFTWKTDPLAFYDEYVGIDLVRTTMEASKEYGQNPNAVGKSRRHWESLYNVVKAKYLELQAGED